MTAKIIPFPKRPPQHNNAEEARTALLESMRRHPSWTGSRPSTSTSQQSQR